MREELPMRAREAAKMSELIVVGVDGSETARLATRWAAREARERGATLRLVSAWSLPTGTYYGPAPVSDDLVKDLVKAAEDTLAVALQEVRDEAGLIDVETSVEEGQASQVLLDASRTADLLVVGSRGLGGFRELLLGSVSQQLAHHATCPVVIVRHVHAAA
jgi:nucleotide-binding universal stress UspA family protein